MPVKLLSKHFDPYHHTTMITEESALYLTHTIRSFAVSLVGIFLPLYILGISKEYIYFDTDYVINGLVWILLYFVFRSFSALVFLMWVSNLVFTKLQFRRSILLSFVITILNIVFLLKAENNIYFLFLAAICSGLVIVLYWVPYHIAFIRKTGTKDSHYGKKTGTRMFLVRISGALAPLIGGLIIASFGFNVLFIISLLLLTVAGLPVFVMVTEHKHSTHDVYRIMKEFIFNTKTKYITASFVGAQLENVIFAVFWGVLLFLVLQDFVKLGLLKSVTLLASSFTYLWLGSRVDKSGTRASQKVGVLINTLLYIPRIITSSALVFYAVDILDKLNGPLYTLPRMSLVYEKARKLGESDFIIYREIVLYSTVLFSSMFLILFVLASETWRWVFVIAMIGSLMSYFIEFDKNK